MPERLQPGDEAPDFQATLLDGRNLRLTGLRGHLVWLAFYRYAGCPICNLHFASVMRKYQALKQRDIFVLAVFESGPDHFPQSLAERRHSSLGLISDTERLLYDLYGVENRLSALIRPTVAVRLLQALFAGHPQRRIDGPAGRIPAHFLIAEDGIIEQAYYGANVADNIPWATVEKFFVERRGGIWSPTVVL